MPQDFNASYWQQRYTQNLTGWDTGAITTPLKSYFDQLENKTLRILIPGCGNAYEAEYLFRNGFKHVYLVDIALAPLQNFAERVPDFPKEQLLHQDFFELEGKYDLMVEQTFFCALEPSLRPAYAQKAASLLEPGGKLAGLLFSITFDKAGPPFGGSKEEYEVYFKPYFRFKHFSQAYNSIPPRQGSELFMVLEK
ncbi:methyltransferase domain-containing protein [uncultured Pontibacter sp.]|uniref:methyltransferase domain-containing protein n=1 Tax=uncultured Pontibacter sp. TaxID=453356 RepID=UPI00260B3661|nr:methyltransferase domain-containing protein [uncultured Pontibacter sp.]